jgi:transcriptional regulator with XRE-family HTH domain
MSHRRFPRTVGKSWGQDFADTRKRRRKTQSEVARSAGVSQAFVSRFENGRDIRVSQLEALYAALGCRARVTARLAPQEHSEWPQSLQVGPEQPDSCTTLLE